MLSCLPGSKINRGNDGEHGSSSEATTSKAAHEEQRIEGEAEGKGAPAHIVDGKRLGEGGMQ